MVENISIILYIRIQGILWVSVSGLRELWGGGKDWRNPGEREEDEESLRPGGHGGRQQQTRKR